MTRGATTAARTGLAFAFVLSTACSGGSTPKGGLDAGDAATGVGQAGATGTGAVGGGVPTGTGGAPPPVLDAGACDPNAMGVDPALLPECPMCPGARCVPLGLVPADQADQLADCPDAQGKCVPDALVRTMGNYAPPSCRSLLDAEGRCLSVCIPAIGDQKDRLPRDTCADGELCAPCFDPVTGDTSGACDLACDTGATESPVVFGGCCGDVSVCVPLALVPEAQRADLARDACDKGELCVPRALAQDAAYVPPTCASLGGGEGRCLAACLPAIADQADRLERGTCAKGHLCAPCYDPLTGAATGACEVGGDPGPADPPYVFPDCCDGISQCIPSDLVPASERGSLGRDTCDDKGSLCVPKELATDPDFVPKTCSSIGGGEGRCLPACLPDIAAQADRLPRDNCDEGYLCAPCYDPASGDLTGACGVGGDPGPTEDPYLFPECCAGAMSGMNLGACVPMSLVAADQQSALGMDTCGAGELCAPKSFADPSAQPAMCASLDDAEGRCLPECLPDVQAQLDQLPQSSCPGDHRCVPCFDPLTGEDTGACTVNGDSPGDEPYTFPECCGGISRCIPQDLVPEADRASLGQDSCPRATSLCVPKELVADPAHVPTSCDSIGGGEGRCVPACLPDIAAQAGRLPQDVCLTGYLCAPCYDPVSGALTGACDIGGDTGPTEPPYLFPECCLGVTSGTNLGVCVPMSFVPADQQGSLGMDSCGAGELCAPRTFADASMKPASCDSIDNAEGRCLPECLPDVQAQLDRLPQDGCAADHRCAPCYDPITGEDTGACTVNGDMPAEPPYTFPRCCGSGASALGVCLDPSLVPDAQEPSLGQDSCAMGRLCAPIAFTDPVVTPTPCQSYIDGFEGRCLPACLPDLAAQGMRLHQDACAAGHVCAPCWDPITGADTGACTINGDAPTTPANQNTFARCCTTNGTPRGYCVMQHDDLIPPADQASLTAQTCSQSPNPHLCVPDIKAEDATATFPPCSYGAFALQCFPPIFNLGCAGACLPGCFVPSSQAGALGQQQCQTGELCAPCSDPLSGASTGACD